MIDFMSGIKRDAALFSAGAAGYSLLEVAWRGHTHWSMAAAGGVCLLLLYRLFGKLAAAPLVLRCLAGGSVVTAVEFATGLFVNRAMGWNVWDYSKLPGNLLGQICPLYSALWVALCLPVVWLTKFLRQSLEPGGK